MSRSHGPDASVQVRGLTCHDIAMTTGDMSSPGASVQVREGPMSPDSHGHSPPYNNPLGGYVGGVQARRFFWAIIFGGSLLMGLIINEPTGNDEPYWFDPWHRPNHKVLGLAFGC